MTDDRHGEQLAPSEMNHDVLVRKFSVAFAGESPKQIKSWLRELIGSRDTWDTELLLAAMESALNERLRRQRRSV